MGKRITLDLTRLIGYELRPSYLKTMFTETFNDRFGDCYIQIQNNRSLYHSYIISILNIKVLKVNLTSYEFEAEVFTSKGNKYTLHILISLKQVETISDIIDLVLGGISYKFTNIKRNKKYEIVKITPSEKTFNIEKLWKY